MSSKITWRRFHRPILDDEGKPAWDAQSKRDWDAVVALHHEQELALGRPMDLPEVWNHPVLVTMLAERDGEIVGGFYFESCPEFCMMGRDPEVTASARRRAPKELGELKACGFRIIRTEVPSFMDADEAESIAKELLRTGFESTDGEYTHYKFDLRPGRV